MSTVQERYDDILRAIKYIQSGGKYLNLVANLIQLLKDHGDGDKIEWLLGQIHKNRQDIFTNGLYQLPKEPLQHVVEEMLSETEEMFDYTNVVDFELEENVERRVSQ